MIGPGWNFPEDASRSAESGKVKAASLHQVVNVTIEMLNGAIVKIAKI